MSTLSLVLGIRPDVIRASLIIRSLRDALGSEFEFVWTGQHYSSNMKDVFFRQLQVPEPDVTLRVPKANDLGQIAGIIEGLGAHWADNKPAMSVFLGDTNSVLGSIAAASLNIPIAHIEGCMRSYDWRMPEEKYRTVADQLSDRIYSYLEEYKQQGLAEGLREENILVTGNPIVDVLDAYFFSGKIRLTQETLQNLHRYFGVSSAEPYFVMTCHRRENIDSKDSLDSILRLAGRAPGRVLFFAGYRTQQRLEDHRLTIPRNIYIHDPTGYVELLELLVASSGVLTDSGTIVEEASILGVPSVQMRLSTERPQVYDNGGSIRFNPSHKCENDSLDAIFTSLEKRNMLKWEHNLGDGQASTRIVNDLLRQLDSGAELRGHEPEIGLARVKRNFGWGAFELAKAEADLASRE